MTTLSAFAYAFLGAVMLLWFVLGVSLLSVATGMMTVIDGALPAMAALFTIGGIFGLGFSVIVLAAKLRGRGA